MNSLITHETLENYLLGKGLLDEVKNEKILYRHDFNSYSDMVRAAEFGPNKRSKLKSAVFGDDEFSGCSFDAAIKKAWFGDKKILEKVQKMRDTILHELNDTTFTQEWMYAESGSAVDVAKFVTGEPECMFDILPTERRSVTIAVNMSYCWDRTHEQVICAGAAIFIIAEWFHRNRYNVKILGEENCSSNGYYYLTTFPIKDFHQPFDTGRIAFTLAHPAFLRRVLFGVNDSAPDPIREYFGMHDSGGYGSCTKNVITPATIALSIYKLCEDNGASIKKAVEFIKTTINQKYE